MRNFKKFFYITSFIFIILFPFETSAQENNFSNSEAFLKWLESKSNSNTKDKVSKNNSLLPKVSGYIPLPFDLSDLADNPPEKISTSNLLKDKSSSLPSKFDLREQGTFLTSTKDQGEYGTCWAFAGIGAMESNYMMQGNSKMDLSVMHLAWFAYQNEDSSKAFTPDSYSKNGILGSGGNAAMTTATYSRLDGPVLESSLTYGTTPSNSTPESYTRVLRLKDVFFFNADSRTLDSRTNIKERIMTHGAVQASYCGDAYDGYAVVNGYSTFYFDTDDINHAVLLVGWDDNFSKDNFRYKPSKNGAWLVKNSWGDKWNNSSYEKVGDNGYFWMSYEQTMSEGTAFIVEPVNSDLKCYYYDALGWIGNDTSGYKYSANIFQSSRDDEKINEVAFYTPTNNVTCTIKIYTGISSVEDNPDSGTLVLTQKVKIPNAGYHTVTLDNTISVSKNSYFSVVLGFSVSKMPIEYKIRSYSSNVKIEPGSFFSKNGKSWDKGRYSNACVKAFTVTKDDSPIYTTPEFSNVTLNDGFVGEGYSKIITVKGVTPIKISSSGLPSGVSAKINGNLLTIAGTPKKEGNFNLKITLKNKFGNFTDTLPLKIWEKPSITTKSLKNAKTDKPYSVTLTAKGTENITWTAAGLPDTLTLTQNENGTKATISGTPTEAGTYAVTFTAENSFDLTTKTLNLKVDGVAPKITFKLSKGTVNSEYTGSKIYVTGTKPITFTHSVTIPSDLQKYGISSLSDLGLTLDYDSENASAAITGTPTISFKNLPITITAQNSISKQTKTAKLTITGQKPQFISENESSYTYDTGEDVNIDFEVEATSPLTFTASGLGTLTFKQIGNKTAKLSGKAPTTEKKLKITIKASCSDGNVTKKITIQTQKPSSETAISKYQSEIIQEHEKLSVTNNISGFKILNERDISELSPEFLQKISDSGFKVAAVLPEISVEEDNTYEFEAEINENIPENSKLIWLSQSDESESENSELIAFYDSENTDSENIIENVPESHKIIIEVWLKSGKYSPLILAEIDNKN